MGAALDVNNTHKSNRNLWIILGTILGLLVITIVSAGIWICRKRLQKRGILPTRTVTPLDDAEFESWRRPSEYHQRPNRYAVMPRQSSPIDNEDNYYGSMMEKEILVDHPASPPRSRQSNGRERSRTNSIQDRPPTPYSIRGRPDSIDFTPSSVTKPKRTHVHYPSVSEASEFDFEFEKFDLDMGLSRDNTNASQDYHRR